MSSFAAPQLDLSRLPSFTLVDLEYEVEFAAIRDAIVQRLNDAEIPYDVGNLETDPYMILAQEFAYRKLKTAADINVAGKQMSLQFSYGAALDHLAATQFADLDIARLVVGEDADGNAIMEEDARFRARIALAPALRSPGTLGSYEYWTLTAVPDAESVRALNYASGLVQPGQIRVSIFGGADEAANVETAQDFLRRDDIKMGTDEVTVVAAPRAPTDITAVLEVRGGPDPSVVLVEAKAALASYIASVKTVGAVLSRTGIIAALTAGGVLRVRLTDPVGDVVPSEDGIVEVGTITVTTEVVQR